MSYITGLVISFQILCIVKSLAPTYYGLERAKLEYELPPLEFGFSELEPYIDEETVRVHYLGHHSKYTQNMNAALKEWRAAEKLEGNLEARRSVIAILRNLTSVPETWRKAIRNNAGGYVNHNLYWATMSPNSANVERVAEGKIAESITKTFGSFQAFRQAFTNEALSLFGSGYVWLCRRPNPEKIVGRQLTSESELLIISTTNQDSPISEGLYPILVIDVWEHAYYLKHQNMRANYVNNWWMLVDWEAVSHLNDWWNGAILHDEL